MVDHRERGESPGLVEFWRWQSRPTFESVTPVCASIRCTGAGGGFPRSNGFNDDLDSGQYASDFTLDARGFGFQELLQLCELGGQLFKFVDRIRGQARDGGPDTVGIDLDFAVRGLSGLCAFLFGRPTICR
jgi:hypothetical protein